MLIIESNFMISSTSSRVLDSSSSAYICTSMQGLIESRRLRKDDIIFWISNRANVTAEAIGTYSLRLPSEFRFDLKDCCFVPVASQN